MQPGCASHFSSALETGLLRRSSRPARAPAHLLWSAVASEARHRFGSDDNPNRPPPHCRWRPSIASTQGCPCGPPLVFVTQPRRARRPVQTTDTACLLLGPPPLASAETVSCIHTWTETVPWSSYEGRHPPAPRRPCSPRHPAGFTGGTISSSRVWMTKMRAGESSLAISASASSFALRSLSRRSPINSSPSHAAARNAGEPLPHSLVKTSASTPPRLAAIAPIAERTRSANMSKARRARGFPWSSAASTRARSDDTPEMPNKPEDRLSASSISSSVRP